MSLGVKPDVGQIKVGDTADLYASLRIDEQPVGADSIARVIFVVQKPNETKLTSEGITLDDGRGFFRWTDTAEAGFYLVQAQFTLVSGEISSVMSNFSVVDPFADNTAVPTPVELITQAVWLRLEDIFDSEEGGPWLREKTLAHFDEAKIAAFISEALMDINLQMPPTRFDITFFTVSSLTPGDNPNMPLLIKGVLCLTIRHLMRSYAEQYVPQGAQVVWPDRTRYTQIWQTLYQVEYADYIQAVRLWKRTTLNLGHSAVSIFSKSGRSWPYSNQRARGAFRGYF